MTSIQHAIARVPVDYMREGVERYLLHGIPPGGFLTALLCNNLKETIGSADTENLAALLPWARWLYNDCPSSAQGSVDRFNAWCLARQSEAKAKTEDK